MPLTGAVVVTGASRGIGRALVRRLDARGYRVFAGVRTDEDAAALSAAASGSLTPIRLDVTDEDSITAAGKTVSAAVGDRGLGALVNNAGMVMAGPLEGMAVDRLRLQFEVNVVGALATTQQFLPLIRQGRGRIINVSSISGRVATRFVGAYAASKFALEGLSDALRLELRYWDIPVILVEPGAVDTDIWDTSRTQAVEAWQDTPPPVRTLYDRVIQRIAETRKAPARAIPAERVALTIERALTSARPKPRYLIGWDARIGVLVKTLLPTRVMDRLLVR